MARVSPALIAILVLVPALGVVFSAPTATAEHTFYGTTIRTYDHRFLAASVFIPAGATAHSVPFVLMTHGWAGSRETQPVGRVLELLNNSYGVFTWDSRGFGESGGEVELDSPDYEVRDVSSIVTFIAQNVPQAILQGPNDPLVGMSGGSYAGGIQLLAAAFDPRIDAIAPEITWNDLAQSLGPNGVPKLAWTTALFGGGLATSCQKGAGREFDGQVTTGCQTSDLASYYAQVHATNSITPEVRAALEYRSPKNYNENVRIPTLLIQGFPDTLFDVNQAAANYAQIKANGVPVKMWLYDGGHALPGTSVPNTQAKFITPTAIKWFDRYLKGNTSVDTGPEVEYYLNGSWHGAPSWPVGVQTSRSLGGLPALSQGPVTGGPPATFVVPLAPGPLASVGPTHVGFDVGGEATEAYLFLHLAVETAGATTKIDGQTQPIRVPIPVGGRAHVEMDLVDVAANVPAGSRLAVVFGTSDPLYNANRLPGLVTVVGVTVDFRTGA